ncbi:TonB-dependent receptor [Hymenobacter sp. HSC-4F20]|uniref:outer membrane beta-barrel protein n=1 Tax=Hymenobacter sp. HSC-4F20 TaxID=2864135 RepID=UPI001C72A094|nr:outer membrane beta-barrel protein [Hymenobacter sp. HSC-4F20]MBX0289904.1 TonB-dependent receptor [Hymenobacter sp. HSC-4F20]
MKTLFCGRPRGLLLLFLMMVWLSVLSARVVQAQSLGGVVRTAAGAPVEYATVVLHRAADSAVVKTEFSDGRGIFGFEQLAAGRYVVSASQVGFRRAWAGPLEVVAGAASSPLTLTLPASSATALKEVTITGQRPTFERQADRTIVNVEGSTLAAGNTSLDVLRRSPGVTVDGNDNLSLRGKQGLLVLIDGKRQPMTGTELADYLRSLPAEQLKSIELITNPPAKYDAQGGAGVIAITLKKDQRLGTNGSANLSYGRSQYNKYVSGLSLNHGRKNLNLFGSYGYSDRSGIGKLTIHRDFYRVDTLDRQVRRLLRTTDQDNRSPNRSRTHTWKAGLDYTLSKRTTLGAVVSGLQNRNQQDARNETFVRDLESSLAQQYRSANLRQGRYTSLTGNANLRHSIPDSLGTHELTADVDVARYLTTRDQRLETRFDGAEQIGETILGDQQGRLTIQSAKADYVRPLTKQLRLETGAKTSLVSADNDVQFLTNGTLDQNRSNRFRYEENINAGYFNLNYSLPRLTLQAGLRGEQTNAVGQQDMVQAGRPSRFDRHYFQLFPSAALKRTFSEQQETSFSLSRRLDRPSYNQLNPFRIIIDKTTSGAGNPDLRPQTSYNAEATHTYRQKYSLGLSYSLTSNPLIGVVQPETDSTVVSTTQNLSRQHYYALTLTVPVEVAKWWNSYTNAVFYYSRFEGNLAGTNLNRGRGSFNLTSNHTFTFGKGWSAELNGTYQSREIYGFILARATGEVSAGVQKNLWNRKGTLKLSMADIFFTSPQRAVSSYDNYVERYYQRQDSRLATLALSYRFGNDQLAAAKRRGGGAEEEKRRAGGQ